MSNLVLYCKSYRDDVLRACQLIRSVERFNVDALPLYLSVPHQILRCLDRIVPAWIAIC